MDDLRLLTQDKEVRFAYVCVALPGHAGELPWSLQVVLSFLNLHDEWTGLLPSSKWFKRGTRLRLFLNEHEHWTIKWSSSYTVERLPRCALTQKGTGHGH